MGDLVPEQKCLSTDVPVALRRQAVALTAEGIVDRAVRGQEAMGMAGGSEAAHLPFPLSRRLMRQLGTVVKAFVLASYEVNL